MLAALIGFLAGWIVEEYFMRGRRGLFKRLASVAGLLFALWLIPMALSILQFNGYCTAFVGERWPCSFWPYLKHEAALNLFLFLPLYLVGMIFYILTSVIVWRKRG